VKRKTRESKKDRVRKGVSGRGRWRERCEVNCEIKLEVKTAEMIKNARGAVRLFPTFNTSILIVCFTPCSSLHIIPKKYVIIIFH